MDKVLSKPDGPALQAERLDRTFAQNQPPDGRFGSLVTFQQFSTQRTNARTICFVQGKHI